MPSDTPIVVKTVLFFVFCLQGLHFAYSRINDNVSSAFAPVSFFFALLFALGVKSGRDGEYFAVQASVWGFLGVAGLCFNAFVSWGSALTFLAIMTLMNIPLCLLIMAFY